MRTFSASRKDDHYHFLPLDRAAGPPPRCWKSHSSLLACRRRRRRRGLIHPYHLFCCHQRVVDCPFPRLIVVSAFVTFVTPPAINIIPNIMAKKKANTRRNPAKKKVNYTKKQKNGKPVLLPHPSPPATTTTSRKVSTNALTAAAATSTTPQQAQQPAQGTLVAAAQRLDPHYRGIHSDAIQAGYAPTSGSTCVDCHQRIVKGDIRWGIKYGGNPLPLPVLPLYGTHPMVLWCHANCGRTFYVRRRRSSYRDNDSHNDNDYNHNTELEPSYLSSAAARTCHACSDVPDVDDPSSEGSWMVKLWCGGLPGERGKIRSHAFHVSCWKQSIERSLSLDDDGKHQLLCVHPSELAAQHRRRAPPAGVVAWADLTSTEQDHVVQDLGLVPVVDPEEK